MSDLETNCVVMPDGIGRGMSTNPFAGCERLDTIDFLAIAGGSDDPMKLLALRVIAHAANNYLFFGLGRNGTTVELFWEAAEFLFRVRSYLPETWQEAKYLRHTVIDPDTGKKRRVIEELSDEALKMCCFDRYYEASGLEDILDLDVFVEWVAKRREEIIVKNKKQVDDYIDFLRSLNDKATDRLLTRCPDLILQPRFELEQDSDRLEALVRPTHPDQVSTLVHYPLQSRPRIRNRIRIRRKKFRPKVVADPTTGIRLQKGQTSFLAAFEAVA